MNIDPQKLGLAIKKRRSNIEMTQHELAGRTELTVNFISLVENGKKQLSMPALGRIADALGVPSAILVWSAEKKRKMPEAQKQYVEALKEFADALLEEPE